MRFFLLSVFIVLFSKVSFSQGTNCYNADPFCTGRANGTGSGIDVDFICYGPFSSPTGGCGSLTAGNTVDCSYSTSASEVCTIPSAVAGQYYILLLTNYSNTSGYISFSQTGGTGSTDCSILCPLSASGITTPTTALTCTNSAVAIYADESPLPVGQTVTPCLKFEVPLTDNSGKNILEVYENGTLLGCFRPATSTSTCSPNAGVVPNNNKWDVYASFLDPTLPHTFKMCEDNSASTSGNMSYKIFDCYSTTGVPIASGTWTVNTSAAYPGSCQSITIPPGTGAGQWNFTGSSSFTGPGITTTNWGGALFNPSTAGPGTHVITYNWNNGQSGAAACAGTKTVAITVGNPFNAAFTTPGPFCASASCATLTPTNTYTVGTSSWSGTGVSGNTFCPITAGVGTFPVTYSVGTSAVCRSSVTHTVTVNAIPTANAGPTASITCSSSTATLSGSGGGSYAWSGTGITSGATTANPTVNQAGTYTLVVTASGCPSLPATVTVTQNTTTPTPTANNSTILTCLTNTATLTGTGGGTYSWNGPGIVSGGSTSTPTVNAGGNYTLTVTAANGCTATAVTTVTQNITPPTPSASNTTTLDCIVTTATLTGSGGGSYNWNGPGIISGATGTNPVVNQPGGYTLTVTAANGCTATANTTVTQNTTAPSPNASNSGSLTCTTTSVTLTGTGGGSYSWSGPSIISGATTANPVVDLTGTYQLTVTAANGCTATANTTVGQNTVNPVVNMPSTQTLTCISPTVTLIGSATPSNANPVWTGGACAGATSYTASACSANTYTLTVTDPTNGCSAKGTVDVVPSVDVPNVIASNTGSITCTTGTVQVSATTTMTPVSYSWSGPGLIAGASSSIGDVNVGGTYQCIVTNTLSGCSSTVTTVVPTNTTAVAANAAPSVSLTCLTSTSTLSATPTGTNYSYSWSGPGSITNGTTENPTVDTGGDYVVAITDNTNGCVGNYTVTVPTNSTLPVGVNAGTNQTLTCSSPSVSLNGSVTSPSNGTPDWTGPVVCGTSTNFITSACAAGIYTLTVTDPSNGCTATSTVEVFPNAGAPTATISSTAVVLDCNNTIQTVTVTSTPNSDVTYSWNISPSSISPDGSVASFTNPNTYICTVTNTVSNCSTPVQVVVTTNTTSPGVLISGTQTLTCASPSAVISTSTTPISGITYSWLNPVVSGQGTGTVTVNVAGTYTVLVTDAANGCTNTAVSQIDSDVTNPVVTISATSSNTIITCQSPSVTLTANVTPSGTYGYV
ncbi:MAG: hypothetical protein HY062_11495, partial [Bacteroidetes bacterium]|nr:hypothetical protein [Bacteroidota bacterium]